MKTLDITTLQNALNDIESYLPNSEVVNTNVSKVNVSWHLDHSLKVINAVVTNIENSDPTKYINNFSFLGRIVFALNYIPRGKGKAPKSVIPNEIILIDDIKIQLAEARERIKIIPTLDKNAFFKHPLFGNVNTARVIKFLDAHTNHHLKIMKSILKS
ncbi:hypothetical protein [Winogradskyella sp. PG-2]|uniref:hypothetical protein n=1 Tax=Winogradskyella sp. PG-2 TaxID=754409 RepID=UPI0004585F77|nr:hypothetical protein [Winogradskyella sp. PG-2]BAO75860.1 hypothetical protein WPG_1630 [Winogradskyella sp. PG-2]